MPRIVARSLCRFAHHLAGRLGAVLAACALVGAAAAQAEPLTVAVSRTPLALPLQVAQVRGFFAEAGLEVRLQRCPGAAACMQMLATGAADLVGASELTVVLAGFEGADAAILATLATSGSDLRILVRRALVRTGTAQLAGARFGVVPGSATRYFLEAEMMNLGIDPRAVPIASVATEGLVGALRSGQVDAVAAAEPVVSQILREAYADVTLLPSSGAYLENFGLVARHSAATARMPDLVRLLRALQRAQAWIADDPVRAQAFLRNVMGFDADVAARIIPASAFRLSLSQSLLATMEAQARWALREGRVSFAAGDDAAVVPNVLNLVESKPLAAAQPAAVGIGH